MYNSDPRFQYNEPVFLDGHIPCNYVQGKHGHARIRLRSGNYINVRESRLSKRTPVVEDATQTDLFDCE